MKTFTRHAIAIAAAAFAAQAAAQVTVYEQESFEGRSYTASTFRTESLNVSSLIVRDGNMWEACDSSNYGGFCTRLMPGQYPSIASMGHRNRIASLRMVSQGSAAAPAAPVAEVREYRDERRADYREDRREDRRDYRRRTGERVFEVPVANVRAVVGAPEQRCWVEREQVSAAPRGPSVGGAIAGVVLGGIIGHQIGGGRDLGTVGGAVVGGAVGSQVGRASGPQYQDVQRCDTVSSQTPAYWDVTYFFRGQEHRVQMTTQPGSTIIINESGEPRV